MVSNDECVDIQINTNRINTIKDKELKKRIKKRIIKTWKIKVRISNKKL